MLFAQWRTCCPGPMWLPISFPAMSHYTPISWNLLLPHVASYPQKAAVSTHVLCPNKYTHSLTVLFVVYTVVLGRFIWPFTYIPRGCFKGIGGDRVSETGWKTQIARFMRPTWGPPGSCRPQMGPINLAIRGYIATVINTTKPKLCAQFMGCILYIYLSWHGKSSTKYSKQQPHFSKSGLLFTEKTPHLSGTWIPIINLRLSDDRLRLIMGISYQ